MKRNLIIALWVLILALVLFYTMAYAHDDGRYANSPLKDWVRGLKDKNGQGCCDTADGFPAEVEWDDVPDSAVIEKPNRLGYPMVWYWRENGAPRIRCFIPGAGG